MVVKITDLRIGSIFYKQEEEFVLYEWESLEDQYSTEYNRIYYILRHDDVYRLSKNKVSITPEELKRLLIAIPVIGHTDKIPLVQLLDGRITFTKHTSISVDILAPVTSIWRKEV